MELRLTLKGPERLLGGRRQASLVDGAIVIGRSLQADWPIPDPERVLSKLHCKIEKDFDGFQLTDLSTNGVKVNEVPVGYGLVRRIEDGDVLNLGDAVLVAEIAVAPPAPAEGHKRAPASALDDGPFGIPDNESPATGVPLLAPDNAPAKATVLDDWWCPVDELGLEKSNESVDRAAQMRDRPIADIHAAQDPLWSHDSGGLSLLPMTVGLDVEVVARAVEAAAAVLSESERGRFRDRLSELLSEASRR